MFLCFNWLDDDFFFFKGASVFVIMLHATMYDSSDPAEQFEDMPEITMEEV